MLTDAPVELVILLASSSTGGCHSWANQVLSDLCIVYGLALFPFLSDPETNPVEWFSFVTANPKVFKAAFN